jgi:hypothetical protein
VIETESTEPISQNGHDQPEAADPDTEMTDARTPNGDAAAKAEDAATSGPKKVRKYYIGDGEVNTWRQNMEIRNPLKDGLGRFKQSSISPPTPHPFVNIGLQLRIGKVLRKYGNLLSTSGYESIQPNIPCCAQSLLGTQLKSAKNSWNSLSNRLISQPFTLPKTPSCQR